MSQKNAASCSGKVDGDRNSDTGVDPASLQLSQGGEKALSHSELCGKERRTKTKNIQENNKIHLNAKKLLKLRLVMKNSKFPLSVLLIKETLGFSMVSVSSHLCKPL